MPLSWNEIKSRALTFSRTWADAANEDSQGKPFWIDFFEIFGITDKRVATFEHAVKKLPGLKAKTDGFVDLFWPGMLLVEQKSRGKNLDAALTQALSYFPGIAERDLPQLVIVCDFARFRVHRLSTNETFEFALKDLHKHIKLFGFVAGYKVQTIQPQNPVNIKAAERMGRLHDALKASGYSGHPLEVLLVRLLFCLFADDTGIFQPAQSFRTFIEERTASDGSDLGSRLAQLFQVLNTDEPRRSQALDEQVAAFPYVNGKLFSEPLPMADFTAAMREALLDACALDWSSISPAIFGSLFQSIMDDKARRNLGAHYTSEENILKLIKPLFLDELWAEFAKVKNNKNRLFEFHKKLRTLTFFDPACGCGNFLVISYRELRELELAVLRASITDGQMTLDIHGLIGINVDQFYGIEIEEFPAQIAQVALWLMDHQMNLRVSEEFGQYFARIPLRTSPHIVHGNALRLDWNEVIPAERCSFVLGNPPFVGAKFMDDAQREDTQRVFAGVENAGLLDFVVAWYVKAAYYMSTVRPELVEGLPASAGWPVGAHEPSVFKIAPTGQPALTSGHERANLRCAFVSTNSITQGEQVGVLWGWLLAQGVHIHFAHRTFSWSNEASGKAAVHCVIIGFGLQDLPGKVIFEYDDIRGEPHAVTVNNINPYLIDGPDVIAEARMQPVCNVSAIANGSIPADGGNLILNADERSELITREPAAAPWIRPYLGSEGFIHGETRYCLWLADCPPQTLRTMPAVMARVQAVRAMREKSAKAATQQKAATPALFTEDRQPRSGNYLAIPRTSSENRRYLPLGYLTADVIAANDLQIIPNATTLQFGVLSSAMHRAWVNVTAGRLKSDIRYSVKMTYNTFPWPEFPESSKSIQPQTHANPAQAAIETAAQTVLDVRARFQTGEQPATLADLYDPLTMPPELLKAHLRLDTAVDKAYEASGGKKHYKSDAERVAFLFELYQKYTSLLPVVPTKAKRKTAAIK
ncbi:MAG: DNA methyltransferase [Rhodoferax sp.]|uniref:DNA methyltransferase n=1 Tax=Rhodoferax sp. TaxID=50421 RepID=UPI003C78E345